MCLAGRVPAQRINEPNQLLELYIGNVRNYFFRETELDDRLTEPNYRTTKIMLKIILIKNNFYLLYYRRNIVKDEYLSTQVGTYKLFLKKPIFNLFIRRILKQNSDNYNPIPLLHFASLKKQQSTCDLTPRSGKKFTFPLVFHLSRRVVPLSGDIQTVDDDVMMNLF